MTSFPALYVICDGELCNRSGWSLVDFAAACLDAGAQCLQIRAKRTSSAALLDTTIRILDRARGGAVVIVNDRADIARLSEASGVHVGQDDLSPALVRSIVGDRSVVGLSTHTIEQINRAVSEPISYLAVGPVFGTATKETGYSPVGLALVTAAAAAARARSLPVIAIGGITLENAAPVIAAGATSVAVASDLLVNQDPYKRVREYLSRLTR